MARHVLIAAPTRLARKLRDAIGDHFEVDSVTDPERAHALAAGTHLAVVIQTGFVALPTDIAVVEVGERFGPELLEQLVAIRDRAPADQRTRGASLAYLASLPYDEYTAHMRAHATRDYLLALLARHRGVVTEAAHSAGILRETLHRLIRRHDIDPAWFREHRE